MAKIGEMLGLGGNPFYDIFASNRQALSGALGGAAANPADPWGGATQGAVQGQRADDAFATSQKAEAERQRGLNSTIEFMRQKGYGDLVSAVEGGGLDMGTAWGEALRRSAPKTGEAFTLGAGEVRYGPNGEMIAQGPEKGMGEGPASYQEFLLGQQNPAYAASLAAKNAATSKPTDAQRRAGSLYSVVEPDAKLLLGTDPSNPGIFDALGDGGSQVWNAGIGGIAPFRGLASQDYQKATDAVTSIVQSYMYVTSGASAPAEEVSKNVALLTPQFGDSKERKEEKKRRLATYVDAIRRSSETGQIVPPVDDVTSGAPAAGGNFVFNPATGRLEQQ